MEMDWDWPCAWCAGDGSAAGSASTVAMATVSAMASLMALVTRWVTPLAIAGLISSIELRSSRWRFIKNGFILDLR